MDLLALINNGVNFLLYCTMSRAFRKTFQKTFCCNCICLFRPIKKATASRSIQAKAGHSLQNRSSLPSEKLNLLSQKLAADSRLIKRVLTNEAIDDDDGLVTINETSLKQNSSTGEADGDGLADGEENKLRKSSAQQDTIPECKESNQTKEDTANKQQTSLTNSSSVNGSAGQLTNSLLSKMADSSSDCKIVNGSLSQITIDSHAVQSDGEGQPDEKSRLKIHRNSSIDSTCDRNRRKQLPHRHNDSRRRYRRKTIANIKSDCTAATGSNCTSNCNGCTTKKSSLTTCV